MSTKKGLYETSAGDTNFRRKWDKAEYEQRAKDRERGVLDLDKEEDRKRKIRKKVQTNVNPDDDDPLPAKELLKARDAPVDLTSHLNKTQVVNTGLSGKQPGYFCEICDCVLKDNVNYLDHMNGRKHQQNMGMSMMVERSTADQVRARLEALKNKKEEPVLDFDARIEKAQLEEEEEKRRKRKERKEKKERKKRKTEDVEVRDIPLDGEIDVANLMGFGGFGSSEK
ncbi:putative zinc finger protein [Phlyctochytrium arcticum]|nr:putative zinc finger protein [Phlyctochytrium arcticum]